MTRQSCEGVKSSQYISVSHAERVAFHLDWSDV